MVQNTMPNSASKAHFLASLVKKDGKSFDLFASRPAAGFPAPADDLVEKSLDINDLVVKNPASTFFVRVEGDSMTGAGIHSGDVLVVDRSITPTDGHIVIAAVYGELVVKKAKLVDKVLHLCSDNKAYEPIILDNNDDCHLWGVVVGSVRQY